MAWKFKRAADAAPAKPVEKPVEKPAAKSSGPRNYTGALLNSARRWGVDPKLLLRVVDAEGGRKGWIRSRVKDKNTGSIEPSYGPLQMLVGGGKTGYPAGMGNQAMEERGIDVRDESQAIEAIDFAVEQISKVGWGQWNGAKKLGITGMMSVGGRPADTQPMQVASRGRAHGQGGASLGAGVGGSNIEGGEPAEPEFDVAGLELEDPLATMTGSEGIPEVDPIDEEEKTLADVLGQGTEFSLDFEGTEETANAGLQRSAELKDEILAMIANGIEAQQNGVLPRLPGFPQLS